MNSKYIKTSISAGIIAIFMVFSAGIPLIGNAASPAALTNVITNTVNSADITTTSATVSGVYNSSGSTTVITRFDWGLSPSFGNSTSFVTYNTSSGSFSATLTGLTPNTQYYVRAFASGNVSGPGYGLTVPFTTKAIVLPSLPTVTTINQTHGDTTATLSGMFNGNGSATTDTRFNYGTSSTNLNQDTGFVTQSSTAGTFTASLSGLSPNTLYYFQAVAKNSAGTSYAPQILSFTTGGSSSTCTIDSFYGSPSNLSSGSSSTLYWETSNCTSVSISNIGSGLAVDGSTNTGTLYSTTTYTLTASNGSQQATDTETITVGSTGSQCTIDTFYANPSSINSGASTTIYWSTSNCSNISISNYGSAGTSGSFNTGALYGNTTYTISKL
jgi:hypothetical protein